MENVIILTICISSFFLIVKLLEMKYVDKEIKPLKNTVKDSLIVGVSSFICIYAYFQFKNTFVDKIIKSFGGSKTITPNVSPEIFTDNPGF